LINESAGLEVGGVHEFEVVVRVRSGVPKAKWIEMLHHVIAEIRDLEDALNKLYHLDYSDASAPAEALKRAIEEKQYVLKKNLRSLIRDGETRIIDIEVR